ncbi:hypothetical protein J4217_03320 [Candidatus Pacearchaeota archaeon]|nr:hypothetical protein [Candidatus Pacearchaeota archaeon]
MGWLKSLGVAGLLPASSGCAIDYGIKSQADLEQRIAASREIIQERKLEAKSLSTREKADYFEKRILNELIIFPYYIIPEDIEKGKPKLGHIEATMHFLSALAYKYAATKDAETEVLASKVISSIIEMDRANGLDGYLPFKVANEDGNLMQTINEIHPNVYLQLFFSYVSAKRLFNSSEISEKISFHSSLIASYFLRNDFVLRDNRGNVMGPGHSVGYNNLKSTGITSHVDNLGGLSLIESCLYLIDKEKNPALIQQLEKQKKYFLRKLNTNDKMQALSFKFLFMEFPTQSTHWLSFLSLHSDIISSDKKCYRVALKRLFWATREQHNPLFDALYLDSGFNINNRNREKLTNEIDFCLRTYPLTLNNREILNSFDLSIERRPPRTIKMMWQKEAKYPLPVYQRGLNGFNWKVNQLALDENVKRTLTKRGIERTIGTGNATYTGNDYLLLYWMNEYLKTKG